MSSDVQSPSLTPGSGIEREAVEAQLARLLANRHFSHSRRFPAFLRCVVDKALAGEMDSLKERTLGVEIFGRKADYDTASDPIVRVTAAEIRKRIAQYYQEPGHEHELRISLDTGSYVPQFHWPKEAAGLQDHGVWPVGSGGEPGHLSIKQPQSKRWVRWVALPGAVLALLILIGLGFGYGFGYGFGWRTGGGSPVGFFWEPVLNAGSPVLLCIVEQPQTSNLAVDAANPDRQVQVPTEMKEVNSDDLSTIVKVGGLLRAYRKEYAMKGAAETTLSDLRNGPTVFVGAYDNAWTMRLTKPLRFHFGNNAAFDKEWIADSESNQQWFTDRPVLETKNDYREYAIVARFTDPNTGQLAVIAAGIGQGSTLVAGDFLTDSANLAELERDARAAGGKKNIEAVLSTQIINGQAGTPKIEATYFW